MKILSRFLNNLTLSNKIMLSKIIRDIISYDKIEIDEKMIFSSTSFFSIKNSDSIFTKEAFPLKLFLPDFILENFSLHDREQKNLIIDFLKIFINEIIFLTYYIEINKKIQIYTFSFQETEKSLNITINKRNLILIFEKYFKEKISIKENIPKKIKNDKQFKLGENCIYSRQDKNNYLIGESFYSFLNRIFVSLIIYSYEFENLKKFLAVIGIINLNSIFSCPNMGKLKSYKVNFVFEKNKCISVFTLPNK
jgi:hypothetical protein